MFAHFPKSIFDHYFCLCVFFFARARSHAPCTCYPYFVLRCRAAVHMIENMNSFFYMYQKRTIPLILNGCAFSKVYFSSLFLLMRLFFRARALTRTMHMLSILRATVSRGSAYDWKYEFLFLYVLKNYNTFDFKWLRIFQNLFFIIIFANASKIDE